MDRAGPKINSKCEEDCHTTARLVQYLQCEHQHPIGVVAYFVRHHTESGKLQIILLRNAFPEEHS